MPLRPSPAWLPITPFLAVLACACATAPSERQAEGGASSAAPSSTSSPRGAPAPRSPLLEPERSPEGSDLSPLPARYPTAAWVPIEAPLLSMQLVTAVEVNGKRGKAVLDTGAMSTVMSVPMAMELGVLSEYTPAGRKVRVHDAHGDLIEGERLPLGSLRIGTHRWVDAEVLVIGKQPDLFLVGADLLRSVDLYIAADEGLVGLFEAGEAPFEAEDREVSLVVSDRQLQVKASARGTRGDAVVFPLIVDTGASGTTVPALVGVNGGLAADLSYESRTLAVGGESQTRGRFVLDPLFLGDEAVAAGRVLAIGSTIGRGEGAGLLGNDVMMRHHTILSWARGKMWLRSPAPRPAVRTAGPGGRSCNTALPDELRPEAGNESPAPSGEERPCIRVALRKPAPNVVMPDDAMPNLCLEVDVAPAYAGKTLELAVTAEDARGEALFNGGALRAFLTIGAEGEHGCFTLWRQLERLGLDDKTRIQLRWVRTEGLLWPCDPMRTHCLTFTGPLARLHAR